MLLPAKVFNYRAIGAIFLTIYALILTLRSFPPGEPSLRGWPKTKELSTSNHETLSDPRPLPLPFEYSATAAEPTGCAQRYDSLFLESASNTLVNYCSETSSSRLTCFHSNVSEQRDSFCIGTPASFDAQEKRFSLNCEERELTGAELAAGTPSPADFPIYWYETGPRIIFERYVQFLSPHTPPPPLSEPISSPKKFTILVRREERTDNLWHHLMQIFSVFLTLDVLQMTLDPATGQPFFRAGDIEDTRVVICDEHEEGLFYDQWTAFAKRPTMRINDLTPELTRDSEKIIIPLPGSANPFWKGDWVPEPCGESKLLEVFSQRMLGFYNVKGGVRDPGRPLVLTFIDRVEKRSLVNKSAYISKLRLLHPDVKIDLVSFASLPFAEQLETVRKTDILAGVHGAGLTHGIFLPPSSAMVEIMPRSLDHKGFRNLAKRAGHQYFTTHATENANDTKEPDWHVDNVFIEQHRFNDLMDAAIKSMYHRGQRDDDVN